MFWGLLRGTETIVYIHYRGKHLSPRLAHYHRVANPTVLKQHRIFGLRNVRYLGLNKHGLLDPPFKK